LVDYSGFLSCDPRESLLFALAGEVFSLGSFFFSSTSSIGGWGADSDTSSFALGFLPLFPF
jgi:hypothetical protein